MKPNKLCAVMMCVLLVYANVTFAVDTDNQVIDEKDIARGNTPEEQDYHTKGADINDENEAEEPETEEFKPFDFSIFSREDETAQQEEQRVLKTGSLVSAGSVGISSVSVPGVAPPKIDAGPIKNIRISGKEYRTDLFTGSASYTHDIDVVPGINGFEPGVRLYYNHQNTGQPWEVGTGWSLSRSEIIRDINGTRANTADDYLRITLNGISERLVYVSSENKYHTEHETFLSIEKKSGAPNDKGEYWIVKTKDGTEYRFGFNRDSELVSSSENYVVRWSMDLVTETHGNKIEYGYAENPNNEVGTQYLDSIRYNNRAASVSFGYTYSIITPRETYGNGYLVKQSGMLNVIYVRYNDQLVRKYLLGYTKVGERPFLTQIQEVGSDDSTVLPPSKFTYYSLDSGWSQDGTITVPSEITFGTDKDEGVRVIDVNADGYSDIVRMKNSADMEYWPGSTTGFAGKKTYSNILSGGFVDNSGNDLGVRFLDYNGDGKTDIIQAASGAMSAKKLLINKGNTFESIGLNLPSGISFVEKKSGQSCTPNPCPNGYNDGGVICQSNVCTRRCTGQTCSGSGTQIGPGKTKYPEWYEDDHDEEDRGTQIYPQSNKCYKFEFTGSSEEDDDGSECYDLYTDGGSDCNGKEMDAYAGIGFAGNRDSGTWLKTIPDGPDTYTDKYIGNADNSYWRYRYLTRWEDDGSANSDGEWSGLDYAICDGAGAQTVHCAPSQQACSLWGQPRCGYGCAGEGTSPFVVLGVYAGYDDDLSDALKDNWDCVSDIDDNDYFGYGTYNVYEYAVVDVQADQSCNEIPEQYADTGVRLADVNGDGKTDLVKSTSSERKTWLNKDGNFVEDSDWVAPSEAVFLTDKAIGTRLADVNGDGLIDIARADESVIKTWINTGKGWQQNDNWKVPSNILFTYNGVDQGTIVVDVNNDGMNDLVRGSASDKRTFINKAPGWQKDDNWALPGEANVVDHSTELSDINADGSPDILIAGSIRKSFAGKPAKAYLLQKITTEHGGSVDIDYEKIASFDNYGGDSIADLGMSGYAATRITLSNGMSNQHAVASGYQYSYAGGLYDADDKEFRGFSTVIETKPDGTKITHLFHQDDAKKGLEASTLVSDSSNSPIQRTKATYGEGKKDNYFIVQQTAKYDLSYDTSQIPRQTTTLYEYDGYGNAKRIIYKGEDSTASDDKKEDAEFVYNTNAWIIDRQKATRLFDSQGNIVRESLYDYDGLANGQPPIKGDVTKAQGLISSQNYATTSYEYDSFGNIIKETDPNGNFFEYAYDNTGSYLEEEKNAEGTIKKYAYHKPTGNILESITGTFTEGVFEIGTKTEYEYDVFGRKTKEIRTYDTSDKPTILINYLFDGTAPETIIIKQRELSGQPYYFDTFYFYDGMQNLIQQKEESESNLHITTNMFYDGMLRVEKTSNPHYVLETSYTNPQNTKLAQFQYDSLGRMISITNPDNTKKTISYDKWNVTLTDENSHKTKYVYDAYGQIRQVIEYNKQEEYTTNYAYDSAGEMTEIKDNEGNTLRFEYDALGRKTKMVDPDLGTWVYKYDKVGNIISQTDARAKETTMSYDQANRMIEKKAGSSTIVFEYASRAENLLSRVITPDITIAYNYDGRLRLVGEDKQIGSQRLLTTTEYDAMDRIIKRTLPDGTILEYAYNNQAELGEITGIVRISYNEAGRPKQRVYNNGRTTTIGYYPDTLRLQSIKTDSIQLKNLTYDKTGNIIKIVDKNKTETYNYDWLDRLTNAERKQAFNITYNYDSIGNMLNASSSAFTLLFIKGSVAHAPKQVIAKCSPSTCHGWETGEDEELPVIFAEVQPSVAAEGTTFNIVANITDNTNISTASAIITYPNSTTETLKLAYYVGNKYNNTFVHTLNYPTGKYTTTIKANDTSNNNAEANTSFTVLDTLPPTLVVSIMPYTVQQLESITIAVNISDNTGVSNVGAKILMPNGSTAIITMSANGNKYSANYVIGKAAPLGNYTLNTTANDTSNNKVSALASFIVNDITPPTIQPSGQDGEKYGTATVVNLSITAIDDYGVQFANTTIMLPSGKTINALMSKNSNTFTLQFTNTTEIGVYAVAYAAVDNNGNIANTSTSFTILDTEEPNIISTSISPSNGSTGTVFAITTTIDDNANLTSVIANITTPKNKSIAITKFATRVIQSITEWKGPWTYDGAFQTDGTMAPGQYKLRIQANDTNNNQNTSTTVYFGLTDNAVPGIVLSITPNNASTPKTFNITINATDNDEIQDVSAKATTPTGTIIQFFPSKQPNGLYYYGMLLNSNAKTGIYTITATATDKTGNNKTVQATFNVLDVSPPSINSLTVIPSILSQQDETNITSNITDNAEIAGIYAKIILSNGSQILLSATNMSSIYQTSFTPGINAPTGQYTALMQAFDTSNNEKNKTVVFTVIDTTLPVINANVQPAKAMRDSQFRLKINASDNTALKDVIANITKPDGAVEALSLINNWQNYETNYTSTALTGIYIVRIRAIDTSNNSVVKSVNFEVGDDTVPSIEITVAPETGGHETVFNITINATDDVGIDWLTANMTLANGTTRELLLSAENPHVLEYIPELSAPVGGYTLFVKANDTSNNKAEVNTVLTVVDRTIPQLNNAQTEPASGTEEDSFTIRINATDNILLSEVKAAITLPNASKRTVIMVQQNGLYEGAYQPDQSSPLGQYDVSIQATDSSDNTNTAETIFNIIDRTAPVVELATISPSSGRRNTKFTISAAITDDDRVGSVNVSIKMSNNQNKLLVMNKTGAVIYTAEFTPAKNDPDGKYTATIIANDASGNTDRATKLSFSVLPELPDLTIVKLKLSKIQPVKGKYEATFTYGILNKGNAVAYKTIAKLYGGNGATTNAGLYDIKVNETKDVTAKITYTKKGKYTVKAYADHVKLINETNELNNQQTIKITV